MTTKAESFAALHVPGDPIVLFNAWDAGSAKAIADAGAKAIATGSWSVAAAHGFADGEKMPRDLAIANVARIVAAVDLPVSFDLESGYGAAPRTVAESARLAAEAGAIGFNFEDQAIGGDGLYPTADQVKRIAAMRAAAPEAFINARHDIFLMTSPGDHDAAMVDAAIERAKAYADAGGSGFFAPGLRDEALIARLCGASPLPVNIMVMADVPPRARLAGLGVARVSHGPGPYLLAMAAVTETARAAFA